MKKILFIFVISLTFIACKKCKDCTIESVTQEICKDDFDSNSDYQAAITALEALGFECK